VIHHALKHWLDYFFMAKTAGFIGHAQVSGIDELDELGRFLIQQNVGITWIGRSLPKDGISRRDMSFALGETWRCRAAVTIGASEHYICAGVHA